MTLIQISRKDGREPCGECHLQAGETCDICGANQPHPPAVPDPLEALKLASNKFAFVAGLTDPMNIRLFAEGAKKFCDDAIAKAEGQS